MMPMETRQSRGDGGLNPVPEGLEGISRSVRAETEGGRQLLWQAAAAIRYPGHVARERPLKFLGTLKSAAWTQKAHDENVHH